MRVTDAMWRWWRKEWGPFPFLYFMSHPVAAHRRVSLTLNMFLHRFLFESVQDALTEHHRLGSLKTTGIYFLQL